jgi:hypothetical protein
MESPERMEARPAPGFHWWTVINARYPGVPIPGRSCPWNEYARCGRGWRSPREHGAPRVRPPSAASGDAKAYDARR